MSNKNEMVKMVESALEREPKVNLHQATVNIDWDGTAILLEGEVDTVAAKKLALEAAASVPGVAGIVDRLRVTPGERLEDGALTDQVCKGILQEQLLDRYSIRAVKSGRTETVREAIEAFGEIVVSCEDGIVTLSGRIGSWVQKRLAGVMSWWARGTRDVVNDLEIYPDEEDNDNEIVDAVRLILEGDPFVDASQVRVTCRDRVVRLDGLVASPKERDLAEADAWYVFGVDRVDNGLEVMH